MDERILRAMANGNPQPMVQIHPVMQLLFPMFMQIYVAESSDCLAEEAESKARVSMEKALAGFRAMGFEWTGGLNCKQIET